jgi:hypothetical protein
MLIPNITMIFPHKPPETRFLENQFPMKKQFFLIDFFIVAGSRACRVSYQNLFFVHLNELLNDVQE